MLISTLLDSYRKGLRTPRAVIDDVLTRADAAPRRHVWIARLTREQLEPYLQALEARSPDALPLYGIPFAIKDNIDLAGVPTTAACPEFAYVPQRSATVVQKLINAGAIPIGKTNLDQFATGLVGVRSPYGACENSIDPEYVSGGSSSGSSVAVALGLVSFALGTDTAGSGRIPAAFNNIVGLKPSCGLLSSSGMLPACRSLDSMSIFALTADDVSRVLEVARGFDAQDAYSRALELGNSGVGEHFRFGVPRREQLEFFGDAEYASLFEAACDKLTALGGVRIAVDFAPFLETARLLYDGPWIAERYAAIDAFIVRRPAALFPTTRQIIENGTKPTAVDAFKAQYRLKALQRATSAVWRDIDMLVTPTAGTIYKIEDVQNDPITLNSNLGIYTNFVNLLDLAALAIPAGRRSDRLPFGVTLIAPAASDRSLLQLGARLHHASNATLGALDLPVPAPEPTSAQSRDIHVVVCGAHLTGLPLNHQLLERGGRLVRATQTAPHYLFYALPGGPPKRPGLVRVAEGGASIAVEVWSVPEQHFGSFVAGIPSPLGIGKVELADGTLVPGFICEAFGIAGAEDITELGGWRAYLDRKQRTV